MIYKVDQVKYNCRTPAVAFVECTTERLTGQTIVKTLENLGTGHIPPMHAPPDNRTLVTG